MRSTIIAVSALMFCFAVGCSHQQNMLKTTRLSDSHKVPKSGMVLIPGGTFIMGSDSGRPDEQPPHSVSIDEFWMDVTDVTNEEFSKFVAATGYKTIAERVPSPSDFPNAPKEMLVPGSLVFREAKGWSYVPEANWRHPGGPASNIESRATHPVVQVAWDDAMAYAKWAGKSLPTEAQFEYAAKGGKDSNIYAWGNRLVDDKKPEANFWQGSFPTKDDRLDGFGSTSPVKSFMPNGYGLFDMSGNVWQWCLDWYRPDSYKDSPMKNPTGPKDSFDPAESGVQKRVVRGGSFLCAECYCQGYRVAARMKTSPDTGLCHTGFRCVINSPRK